MQTITKVGLTVCLMLPGLGVQQAGAAAVPTHPVTLGGLSITWPVSSSIKVAPSTRLSIAVRPTAKTASAARARFTFVRVNAQGHVLKVVARRTLRRGTFVAEVPASPVSTYRLAVANGKATRKVSLTVQSPPPSANTTPCSQGAPAGTGPGSIAVHLQQTTIAPDQALNLTIENTGDICLGYGEGALTWERADPSGWTPIPETRPSSSVAYTLAPQKTNAFGPATAPVPLTTGHYRITFTATRAPGGVLTQTPVTATAELDVS
jgi:hypothetical protein